MKAVVQRVIDAAVTVNGALKGAIARGLLVYLGVARDDTVRDADWLVEKIPHLRIFDDSEGKMNLSLLDIVNLQKEAVNEAGVNHENGVVNMKNKKNNKITTEYTEFEEREEEEEEGEEGEEGEGKEGNIGINGSVKLRVLRGCESSMPIGVLAVSQFTLLGDARKGRRPTWDKAAPPERARELYRYFIEKMREKAPCESGEFQAHMMVAYTNDGPVTILLDSRE